MRLLVEPPSAISVLSVGRDTALLALGLAGRHGLRARRIHDARHAAAALQAGVRSVYTHDLDCWKLFEGDGLLITGPESSLIRLAKGARHGR